MSVSPHSFLFLKFICSYTVIEYSNMQSNPNSSFCRTFSCAVARTKLQFSSISNSHLTRAVLISCAMICTQISDPESVSILALTTFLIPSLACEHFLPEFGLVIRIVHCDLLLREEVYSLFICTNRFSTCNYATGNKICRYQKLLLGSSAAYDSPLCAQLRWS
jgi:hypothetical protein